MLRCRHGLKICVLFVHLVKAFDSIQHEVLYTILKKYGLPLALINIIRKLCNDCLINILWEKKRKKGCTKRHPTRQQHGFHPLPFCHASHHGITRTSPPNLQTRIQILQEWKKMTHWTKNCFPRPTISCQQSDRTKNCFPRPTISYKNLLFVDDGAFTCENRDDIEQATQIIHDHFPQFSLQMHVGTTNSKSKTGAMYFPASLSTAIMSHIHYHMSSSSMIARTSSPL